LYENKHTGTYSREDFHNHPEEYICKFKPFAQAADILMNGIYWDEHIPRLFEKEDIEQVAYQLNVIADITCDLEGSVPINLGASTIMDPVYGVHKQTKQKVLPFQNSTETIDIMAVDNLPNE